MTLGAGVSTGYSNEREAFEAALSAVDDGSPGAIAVLSEPFGGREAFLDLAERYFGDRVTRVRCTPTDSHDQDLDLDDVAVLLVDDCQHRFVRRIGGFDGFDRFLRQVATFDGPVVTSWNTFAWNYLAAVKDLERTFTTKIRLGDLDSGTIRTLLMAEYDENGPELVDDREPTVEPLVVRRTYERPVGSHRTLRVPYAVLNVDGVRKRLARADEALPETLIFDRITQLARGNPGVASYLWQESLSDGRLAYSAIREPPGELGVDYDTAFLLQVLLTKERLSYDELSDVVEHPELDRALGELSKTGVLTVDGDLVVLEPDALKPLVESLERRRVIW
ncbi:hypothetical protein [Haloarchaeobius sp. TZWSO28]|uniref:hypothetical protein n=1 Tax=Haloarchaeobius sp. TZWSO28 TaxID=3446119 RepID=UPI003EB6E774